MRHSIYFAILVAAAGTQLGATDCGQVIRDSGFDLWCDGTLCAWKIERGSIAQVPTWIQGDSGVQLLGSDTAIEQLSPVDDTDGHCIEFDLVANIDDNAEVDLNIDVDGDGTIDSTERLPTSHWQPLTYKLPIAGAFEGIRFELAKAGDGNAVLAQIQATIVDDCGDLPPITPGPAPLGAYCDADADCASALCRVIADPTALLGSAQVCVGCDPALGSGACATGVCGLGDPVSPLREQPLTCVPVASRVLGERCAIDAECVTDTCFEGTCSTCLGATDLACGAGSTCAPSWDTPYEVFTPWICNAGKSTGVTGAPCGADADCASHTCTGTTRSQCSDGRPCDTAATCPFDGDLQQGACTTVGIQGGSCE